MKKHLIDFKITHSKILGESSSFTGAMCGALENSGDDPVAASIAEEHYPSTCNVHADDSPQSATQPDDSQADNFGRYALIGLTTADGSPIPECKAGQFVEVAMPASLGVMLRRPISINDIDKTSNTLWLLVRNAGKGTKALIDAPINTIINILMPLGNGFTIPPAGSRPLLIGGGVGVAPLLYLGREMRSQNVLPTFLLGARSADDLLMVESFAQVGDVHLSTDDGSRGCKGVVTKNPALKESWTDIFCCGPLPMMKAVAALARKRKINCEVSLENMMACGLGACLCCVENTTDGNVCVCHEGPVFNINKLLWQN